MPALLVDILSADEKEEVNEEEYVDSEKDDNNEDDDDNEEDDVDEEGDSIEVVKDDVDDNDDVEVDSEVEEADEDAVRESAVARLSRAKSVGSWVAFCEKKERLQEGQRRVPAPMALSRHEVQKVWPQKRDLGHLSPFPYLKRHWPHLKPSSSTSLDIPLCRKYINEV
ncbi:hypothetical protein Pmani_004492 [Petrolisthes manimaculis]|uniref:Uncharacterized protein n=1 Tax=Petrolisthes manimaculis TaxID=1843537 RepID=A0AAE1ULI4_9EUCA|nr:hypothetical protein Pmani_004492 [Petrolisthes manimaculis]